MKENIPTHDYPKTLFMLNNTSRISNKKPENISTKSGFATSKYLREFLWIVIWAENLHSMVREILVFIIMLLNYECVLYVKNGKEKSLCFIWRNNPRNQ